MVGDICELLEQRKVERWFIKEQGYSSWTPLYKGGIPLLETGVCLYSCLMDPPGWETARDNPSWALHAGSGMPGFSQQYGGDEPVTCYHRYGGDDTIEPLVVVRQYPNIRPRTVEVVEELRHLFNLFEDRDTGLHVYIEDDGSETPVIKANDREVVIYTPLLARYLAVKQKALVFMIDSDVWIERDDVTGKLVLPDERVAEGDDFHLHFYSGTVDEHIFSRLLGKKLILPPDLTECGIWPFEEPKEHESFIIGEDEKGKSIVHTSDPDVLNNYFDANPGAPHYLTPVFFGREVLRRYYENSECYEVEDGIVSYRGLWSLRVDNDSPNHVMVFLGDLGRDLPTTEQRYWRGFNIPRHERGLSETTFRRSFLGQWADTKSPEYRFKRVYVDCNRAWAEAIGWPLFKSLHDSDRHVLERLRIPLTENVGEFDDQVLNLAILLIDSLSEAEIEEMLQGSLPKDSKGITKLEYLLQEMGYPETERDIKLLRAIQGIRSKGAAHRKGDDYDISEAGLDPQKLRGSFSCLLNGAVLLLTSIADFVANT